MTRSVFTVQCVQGKKNIKAHTRTNVQMKAFIEKVWSEHENEQRESVVRWLCWR